tara:strand:+ start:3676 stop:4947 length:1272 start_codon:yes stop_codon:yes gene_type:complete
MAGTGFIDNWEKVDPKTGKKADGTSAPKPRPKKQEATKKNVWGEDIDPNAPTVQQLREEEEAMIKEEEKARKAKAKAKAKAQVPVPVPKDLKQPKPAAPKAVTTPEAGNVDWNPIETEIAAARASKEWKGNYILMGIAGPPKSGKTGSILDSLTDKEIDNGAEIWHLDFDLGGETTKAAHHPGNNNIVVLNPWVLNKNKSRVPYDFPATYQKTLDFLLAAVDQADRQAAYFAEHGEMPKPYLKTICFDGADHWLNICETTMKVDDLKLGPDGISVAGKDATTKIGRFNWNIRKNRYNSALTVLQELCRRGVHCYIITHMKPQYDSTGAEIIGAGSPHWLKDTEGWLQQTAIIEVDEERDDRGELTGIVNSYAVVTQNRTSLKSPGRIHLFRKDKDGGEWYGWPGLRDGSIDHPDNVIQEDSKN